MKAKTYLQRLKWLNTVINQKIRERSDLRAISTNIDSFDFSKDRVQTSPSGDASYVNITNRIFDLDEEIKHEIDTYVDERHKIINKIQGLSDARNIDILYKRYVEFKNFETISVEMGFTYQYSLELHGYALQEFERTYENL